MVEWVLLTWVITSSFSITQIEEVGKYYLEDKCTEAAFELIENKIGPGSIGATCVPRNK